MNYYYITGTSKGLGQTLAELLLENNNNFVYGLSRNKTITHDRYEHITFDLSDLNNVKKFSFNKLVNADRICLVNNAAMIGEIKRLGDLNNDIIQETVNVNITSLFILVNNFINSYSGSPGKKIIANISSGAASHPVDAWSVYCSSKAAMDMMTKVAEVEFNVIKKKDFKILSIPPGVVDTGMQKVIRETDLGDFSERHRFIEYKNTNKLLSPEQAAKNILDAIDSI